MMAKWICTVCNYVHEGEGPPDVCPVCGVGPEKFVRAKDEAAKSPDGDSPEPETLEQVRDAAREQLLGICGVYPACDGQPDRLCQREAYGAPIGLGGAGSGASFAANYTALASLKLKTRLVGDHFDPDTKSRFCGLELAMPIMGSSTAGPSKYTDGMSEEAFCRATIAGCRSVGSLSWRGDTYFYTEEEHPALDALEAEGGAGVPIFKPRAQDVLKRLIERAEKMGCPAVGVDLDGCGSTIMARHGQPVYRKTTAELRELVAATSLPFVAKGIMAVEDAEACVEAGAKVIAVSNHGGRVLDSTPGVAQVLPEIVEAIGERAVITADGGVRTGYDVLKMLALGADAVLVGRDLIRAAIGGREKGVALQMTQLRKGLSRGMLMTGVPTLNELDRRVLV